MDQEFPDSPSTTGEPTTGTCVSCGVPAVCLEPWPEQVPLPEGVVDGLVCDECHTSLMRYVTEVVPILEGPPPPPPRDLTSAVDSLDEAGHDMWWEDKNLTLWRWSDALNGWTCFAPTRFGSDPEWINHAFPHSEVQWLGPFTPVTPGDQ